MVTGSEHIYLSKASELDVQTKYSDETDVMFFDDPVEGVETLLLKEKEYAIFYPENAHKPSIMIDNAKKVKKIVVKIPISLREYL